jgi:hypothetical protein
MLTLNDNNSNSGDNNINAGVNRSGYRVGNNDSDSKP